MSEKIEVTINCYQGELTLKQITPVFEALFGHFDLGDRKVVNNNLAMLQNIQGEQFNPSWNDIKASLIALARDQYGVAIHSNQDWLTVITVFSKAFAKKHEFNSDKDKQLGLLLRQMNLNQFVFDGVLFRLCNLFDDGHGLSEVRLAGYEHITNIDGSVRIGQTSFFHCNQVSFGNSASAIELGKRLDEYLTNDDYLSVIRLMMNEIEPLFYAISDDNKRNICVSNLIKNLAYAYLT